MLSPHAQDRDIFTIVVKGESPRFGASDASALPRERDILAVKRYSDSKAGSHVAEAGVRGSRATLDARNGNAEHTGGTVSVSERHEANT